MTYSAKPVSELADGLNEEEVARSVRAILERRHYSVLRHVVFMFTIEGVSRAFSHQLVRHTAGHAYEQRSQHYRTESDFNLVLPRTISRDSEAMETYSIVAEGTQAAYDQLMEVGVPKDDARFILPNGVETQLVWTANLNALMNFVQQRACRMNTPEIMSVAIDVRSIVSELVPEASEYLGPTCFTQGICFEGKKFYKECNKPWRSPSVLWTPKFPGIIELVGLGGSKVEMDGGNFFKMLARIDMEEEPNND